MRRIRFQALLVVIALIGVGIVLWISLVRWWDPFDDDAFTPTAWVADRAPTARDLVKNHLRLGTLRVQVESLLGRPDEVVTGEDAGGTRVPGTETYKYSIGSWPMYGYDDAFVYVHLDANGNVIGAKIDGY